MSNRGTVRLLPKNRMHKVSSYSAKESSPKEIKEKKLFKVQKRPLIKVGNVKNDLANYQGLQVRRLNFTVAMLSDKQLKGM